MSNLPSKSRILPPSMASAEAEDREELAAMAEDLATTAKELATAAAKSAASLQDLERIANALDTNGQAPEWITVAKEEATRYYANQMAKMYQQRAFAETNHYQSLAAEAAAASASTPSAVSPQAFLEQVTASKIKREITDAHDPKNKTFYLGQHPIKAADHYEHLVRRRLLKVEKVARTLEETSMMCG